MQVWPDGAKYEGEWKEGKANGRGIFCESEVNSRTWMGMCTRDSGEMTKRVVKARTRILTGHSTKGSG